MVKTRSHSTVMVPPPAQVQAMLNEDQQKTDMLRKTFQMFDTTKCGYIDTHSISTIFTTMGQVLDDEELTKIVTRVDYEGKGRVNFDGFCEIASHFLDDDDAEAMQEELKEAFRLYDKEGNGYITTGVLKEILAALDDKLTPEDLDGMISEIDTDGSGTVDFDEFMEMMTGE
ncbi:troponin C [Nesidiocoris tenuis]|uniref:Troponin C n=2 Tax=Nesidiocoris tenuis TaxID=355587 RepID=A0ABN7AHL5_9HEMI|nr:troponin C [Nesidiocoris tenuis]